MFSEAIAARWPVWKEVIGRPAGRVLGVLGVWQTIEGLTGWRLFQTIESLTRGHLSLPTFPWWVGALGWLVLFVLVVLEGAYRSVHDRDNTIDARDETIATLRAAEPRLEVVFDRDCKNCFDYGQSALVNLGVWNAGASAEDVQVSLLSTTPGPKHGKLGLTWSGESCDGRPIYTTTPEGHSHFTLLLADPTGPYSLAAGIPDGHRDFYVQPYTAEVQVEGRNIRPAVRVRVEVDPRKKGDPPILGISPV